MRLREISINAPPTLFTKIDRSIYLVCWLSNRIGRSSIDAFSLVRETLFGFEGWALIG